MVLRNIKVLKPIGWVLGVSGNYISMYDTIIDARSDNGFPFNTGKTHSLYRSLSNPAADQI